MDFSFGLFKKQQSIIGLDIGSSSVKVIQLRKDKGKVVLETYGELSTGPYLEKAVGQVVNLSAEQIATLTKDLFKEANITTKVGAIAIPLRSSLLVNIEVPELPQDKLAQMIPLEARKYVPVPISEVFLDWSIVPKYHAEDSQINEPLENALEPQKPELKGVKPKDVNNLQVLLVAIHKDTVSQYQNIAKEIGMDSRFLEIETFSAMRSSLQNDLGATVIVDMGASMTKLVVISYGIVRMSHTINKGSQDITMAIARSLNVSFSKAEEIKRQVGLVEKIGDKDLGQTISPVVEYIFNEVSQVMIEYQKEHNRSIDKVILIGGGALLKGVFEVAKDNVYAPVVLGTPFDRVEAPAFLEEILKQVGPGFAVAIGLALRGLEEI